MSIDNYIWVPKGALQAKNKKDNHFSHCLAASGGCALDHEGYAEPCGEYHKLLTAFTKRFVKGHSLADLPCNSRHQVFLAHTHLIDEQYFFEDKQDAQWFFDEGYKERLYLDNDNKPMPFDRMAIWIDGREYGAKGFAYFEGITHGNLDDVTIEGREDVGDSDGLTVFSSGDEPL